MERAGKGEHGAGVAGDLLEQVGDDPLGIVGMGFQKLASKVPGDTRAAGAVFKTLDYSSEGDIISFIFLR